ncbi:hypothetical protein Bca4012_072118 [Brassica carinata]
MELCSLVCPSDASFCSLPRSLSLSSSHNNQRLKQIPEIERERNLNPRFCLRLRDFLQISGKKTLLFLVAFTTEVSFFPLPLR